MHYEPPPTSRGGRCVHRPSQDCNDFLLYARPSPHTTEESWIQDQLRKYGTNTARGGRRPKRKVPETNEDPVGAVRKRARPLEEDEHLLEYLTLRHKGNVEAAQLSLLVASWAGQGKENEYGMH